MSNQQFHPTTPTLILGSGSPYRLQILTSLGINCVQIPPEVDETPAQGEDPRLLAQRLAVTKAEAVAGQLSVDPPWVVIGCDQVCHLEGIKYGKPGSRQAAIAQLAAFSGQWVTFTTGLAGFESGTTEVVRLTQPQGLPDTCAR